MKTDRESYRKGVMLGLTLAEIMILILFLLMTILCILWQKQKRMTDAIAEETFSYRSVVNKNDGDPEKRKLIEDIVEDAEIIADVFSKSTYAIASFEEIGEVIDDTRIVVDDNGEVVGYVDENSKIKNFEGEELGKIVDDDIPVDDDGNVLGKIAKDKKVVKNKKGRPIGYADKKGNVVSPAGELIGKADGNGKVRKRAATEQSANRAIIGYFDGKDARDFRGNVLGKLNGANKLLDATGTVSGAMTAPGYVVRNPSGTVVGYVTGLRRVKGQASETVGIVDDNGDVFTATGDAIASVNDCSAIVFDADGNPVGYIRRDNSVADFSHKKTGVADYNGQVLDENREWSGHTGRRVVWVGSPRKKHKAFIAETNKMYSIDGDEIAAVVSDGILKTDTVFLAGGVNVAQLIRDGGGKIAGYLMNGKAVSTTGRPLSVRGKEVSDTNGETVGVLREIVSPARKDGVIVGFVGRNGHFFDFDGVEKGVVDLAGDVWRSSMKKIDHIELAFRSKDDSLIRPREIGPQSVVLEQVFPVRDEDGNIIGRVDDDMVFYDPNGRRKGVADVYGNIAESPRDKRIGTLANKFPLIETTRPDSDVATFLKRAVQSMEITGKLPARRQMEDEILRIRNNEKVLQNKITDLEGRVSLRERQIKQMDEQRRDAGETMPARDLPPCWFRKTGEGKFEEEPSFLYEMTDNGVILHNISPENRREDFKKLPAIPLNKPVPFDQYFTAVKNFRNWQNKNKCRFRARICDRTTGKDTYEAGLRLLYKTFYREEKLNCDGI